MGYTIPFGFNLSWYYFNIIQYGWPLRITDEDKKIILETVTRNVLVFERGRPFDSKGRGGSWHYLEIFTSAQYFPY